MYLLINNVCLDVTSYRHSLHTFPFFPKPLKTHKNAQFISRIGFFTTLITNLNIKVAPGVPLKSMGRFFWKFQVCSIMFKIRPGVTLSVSKPIFMKNTNWSWEGFGHQDHEFHHYRSLLWTSGVNKSIFVKNLISFIGLGNTTRCVLWRQDYEFSIENRY